MPRYFFDLAGKIDSPDDEGVECPDLNSAKVEAIRLMGEILREEAEVIFSIQDCGVVVRDNQGQPLARVQTSIASSLGGLSDFPMPNRKTPSLTRVSAVLEQEAAPAG